MLLQDYNIRDSLTATEHAAVHQYDFLANGDANVLIDFVHGNKGPCTVFPQHDVDTILSASIEIVGSFTIRGYRISMDWSPKQEVFFYAVFSQPFKNWHGDKGGEYIGYSKVV